MTIPAMDVREALYTTRAMRRLKPDPVPLPVQRRILDAAIRAPSGGDAQGWRFMLVDSPEVIGELATYFRYSIERMWPRFYAGPTELLATQPDHPEAVRHRKLRSSVEHLAANFETVPLILFAFTSGAEDGGNIFPAVWSAMLAARAEGVGSTLTSIMNVFRSDQVRAALGMPPDSPWQISATVTMGYPLGRWGIAARRPVHEVAYHNRWEEPLDFVVERPLWPDGG